MRDTHTPLLTPPQPPRRVLTSPRSRNTRSIASSHTLGPRSNITPMRLHLHTSQRHTPAQVSHSHLLCTLASLHRNSHLLSHTPQETRTLGTRMKRHTSHTHPLTRSHIQCLKLTHFTASLRSWHPLTLPNTLAYTLFHTHLRITDTLQHPSRHSLTHTPSHTHSHL